MMDISVPYYEDKTRISNSNIGWFLNKGPAFLHKMLTEDVPEEKSPALERGTMIHEYILQPEEFQKDYVVWDKSRPTSPQQEAFCRELVNTLEIEPNRAILSAYKASYSTKGKSDDVMLSEGLKIASTLKDYIDFLKEDSGRIIISHWDYQNLKNIKDKIENHKLANDIVFPLGYTIYHGPDAYKGLDVWYFHEFHINWEYRNVKCKSLLDGLTLDFKNKIATIYDLKTTQKLWHFEDSIEQYDYLRQLMYYELATKWYLRNECNENTEEWFFIFYIIGIDTTGSNEIRVFKFDDLTLLGRWQTITKTLDDIAWHQINNKWDHSREYYEGDGSESLNL